MPNQSTNQPASQPASAPKVFIATDKANFTAFSTREAADAYMKAQARPATKTPEPLQLYELTVFEKPEDAPQLPKP